MNDMDLLKTMELVDDDIIEKNARAPKRKPSAYFKWAAAAAAALILGILLSALFGGGAPSPSTTGPQQLESVPTFPTNPPLPPTSTAPWLPTEPITFPVPDDLIALSAQDILEIFRYESSGTYAPTDNYEKAFSPELLTNKEIPWTGYLPVYQRVDPEVSKDMLEEFIAQSIPIIQGIYPQYPIEQLSPSNYTMEEGYGFYRVYDHLYYKDRCHLQLELSVYNRLNYYFFEMDAGRGLSDSIYTDHCLPVNGQIYTLGFDDTHEQIRRKLSGLVEYLNQLFGQDYVITDISSGIITRVDLSTEFTSQDSIFPKNNNQIVLYFYPWNKAESFGYPAETVVLQTIHYYLPIIQTEDNYALVGHGTMLTLEEAEVLLEKGYTFSDVPRCGCGWVYPQEELDFSNYDAVELRWIESDDGMLIPFYSFYIQNGFFTPSQKYRYGRVNVPAIAVEDLEAFFESMDENHNLHYYGR